MILDSFFLYKSAFVYYFFYEWVWFSPLENEGGTAGAGDTSDDRINDELGAIAKQIADSNRYCLCYYLLSMLWAYGRIIDCVLRSAGSILI